MSVNILVYGADKESDEYEAAIKMREVIKKLFQIQFYDVAT